MKSQLKLIFTIVCIYLIGCSNNNSNKNNSNSNSESYYETEKENRIHHTDDIENSNNLSTDDNEESNDENTSDNGCKFEDGIHSANVNYTNSETGFSNTYTLDVEVEDCEVVQINFPNGGWLDSSHITPSELDENGTCTVFGEDGKTYEVELD